MSQRDSRRNGRRTSGSSSAPQPANDKMPLLHSWTAPGLDPSLEAQFLAQVEAYEQAPWTTEIERLRRAGCVLPPPAEVADEQLPEQLQQLVETLAEARIYLLHTNHLTDRELYTVLVEQVLCEPVKDVPNGERDADFLDLIEQGPHGLENYVRYYANESDRQDWQSQNPDEPLPPRCQPPSQRDATLPGCGWW